MPASSQAIADGHLYFAGERAVLFRMSEQRLYRLNDTATLVWCLAKEEPHLQAVISHLTRDFGLSPDDAFDLVKTVLDGGNPVTGGPMVPDPNTDRETAIEPPPSDEDFACVHTYALLDRPIKIGFEEMGQEELIHPVLAHLQCSAARQDDPLWIQVLRDGPGHVICSATKEIEATEDRLTSTAKSFFVTTAINSHPYRLFLHAGVVARGNQACLMPAQSGSGKTTLTAALIARGWTYFSDEVALIEGDCRVVPAPMCLSIKRGSWQPLADLHPTLMDRPICSREDGIDVRFLPPPEKCRPAMGQGATAVGWIIFPRYRADQETRLQPMDADQALARLLAECMATPKLLDPDYVERLVDWICRTNCYELVFSDLKQASRLIDEACR